MRTLETLVLASALIMLVLFFMALSTVFIYFIVEVVTGGLR